MKKLLSLFFIVMVALLVISCSSKDTKTEDIVFIVPEEDLLGKEFVLDNLYADKEITISFPETNTINGKNTVNYYFSDFTLDGNKLVLRAIGSTKMAGSDEDMLIETEYFDILNGADTISLDGDSLIITTTSGTNLEYIYRGNITITNEQ